MHYCTTVHHYCTTAPLYCTTVSNHCCTTAPLYWQYSRPLHHCTALLHRGVVASQQAPPTRPLGPAQLCHGASIASIDSIASIAHHGSALQQFSGTSKAIESNSCSQQCKVLGYIHGIVEDHFCTSSSLQCKQFPPAQSSQAAAAAAARGRNYEGSS